MPEWLRVGGVSLAVRDLPGTAAFYREVIGLEVVDERGGLVRLGVGGVPLLELHHRPDALPDDPAKAGLFHIALLLPNRGDLGRWIAHAGRLGQALDGGADHLVSEAVYLHDPEGNGIEVYADRPRGTWSWSEGRVAMTNKPLDRAGLLREGRGPWTGAPAGTRVGHVHLRVGDAAEAARFYGGILGLDVTAAWPGVAFLSSGRYHHHVAANAWHSAGAGLRDPARAGLLAVTFDLLPGANRAGLAMPGTLRDPWGTVLHLRTPDLRTPDLHI